MSYSFPNGYNERCYLVAVDSALIPFLSGALHVYERREMWLTDADYEQAYNAIAELYICMTRLCTDDLIESNNRLYRLLNQAINGQEYVLVSSDPLDIQPVIPAVPPAVTPELSIKAQLERIAIALEATDDLDAEQLAQLQAIVAALA